MAMNPFGVNLDALQMMSNPLLRGFASQQQEEEEPVGFWNKIASRMPGYNLPGMQNDMKRQALNEALIMAGASMMQNAGSGNIGSAIADALTKGMSTYKEGVSSQYQGLQEQRKREMEDLDNEREARRLGISEEQLVIMKEGEKRAGIEFDRESKEFKKNEGVREAARRDAEEKARRNEVAKTYNMEEIYAGLTPEQRRLVQSEYDLNGAVAAQGLAIDFYKGSRAEELERERIKALANRYNKTGGGGISEIRQQYRNERAAAAQATKDAAKVLAEVQEVMSKTTGSVEKKRDEVAAIIAASPFSSVEEAEEAKLALSQFDAWAKEDPDYSQLLRFGRGGGGTPGEDTDNLKSTAEEIARRLLAGEKPTSLYGEYEKEAVDDVVTFIEMLKKRINPSATPGQAPVSGGLPAAQAPTAQGPDGIASRIARPVITWARPVADATEQMSEWQRMLMSLFGSLDDEEGGFEIAIPETVRGKRR